MSDEGGSAWKYLIMWEFRPMVGREEQFEAAYGSDGTWARLFALADGFIATELIHDLSDPGRYLTMDMWASKAAYEKFRVEYADEYRAIDTKCEALTDQEKALGSFERLGP